MMVVGTGKIKLFALREKLYTRLDDNLHFRSFFMECVYVCCTVFRPTYAVGGIVRRAGLWYHDVGSASRIRALHQVESQRRRWHRLSIRIQYRIQIDPKALQTALITHIEQALYSGCGGYGVIARFI